MSWPKTVRWVIVMVISACFLAAASDSALLLADRPAENAPTLLVLGSAHLHNPGRDLVNVQIEDVLTEKRQAEIAVVVDQLASFQPTHIAVEWPQSDQLSLDAHYAEYRAGGRQLERREAEQIGFRLAAKLGLPRVHAVDWNEPPPGDEKLYDWYAYGQANGFTSQITALSDPARQPFGSIGSKSVARWLLDINKPEVLSDIHRTYFDIAMIGDVNNQPGANWVGHQYARNLRIFRNLVQLTSHPDDRILVIYGLGHAHLLRQFARESGAFRLRDVDTVLQSDGAGR